jgi:hypothetical protein
VGKTSQRLTIWVWAPWAHHPQVEALREKGHTIVVFAEHPEVGGPPNPDLLLHPVAHYWHEAMFGEPYLEAALKAARKRKKALDKPPALPVDSAA